MPGPDERAREAAAGCFRTTHWSDVLAAGRETSPDARAALELLCHAYWYPLYSYVRRQGYDPEEAQDLTQEFFSRLLAGDALASVDRARGKFRSFLLASMNHLLANEWHRARRQKRGGDCAHFSLNALAAEERFKLDPPDELTPEKIFERRWAEAVLDAVTNRLQAEFTQSGQAKRFAELKLFLLAGEEPASHAQTAQKLNLTEGAVKSAIYRMRQRYGELLRAEIANTVVSPQEMEEELRHFVAVLSR